MIVKLGTVLFFCLSILGPGAEASQDRVTYDFVMVEKGIDWLKLIKSGADENKIRTHFMQEVAPTRGCRAIIHHWQRFRKWDTEEFYRLILTALGRLPSDSPLKNEDGTPTGFARRRIFWQDALDQIDRLERDLEALKQTGPGKSVSLARKYLPEDAVLDADFYFVLFGASSAFSVGKENGYDFLQLPRNKDGLDLEAVELTLAHELHHSGFDFLAKKNMGDLSQPENVLLLGLLTVEGMPTYFIDQPWFQVPRYLRQENPQLRQVALDWERHSARIKDLYKEAERDIRLNLEGKLDQAAVMETWMSGVKGPAYVLGADMFSVIEGYLGLNVALKVVEDYRKFLIYYNYAAERAHQAGFALHLFDDELVQKVARYGKRD